MFDFKVVKSGAKSIQSTPKIKVASSQNKFIINTPAIDLMNVQKGDNVMILVNPSENPDERFFIVKAEEGETGAKLGESGSGLHFNYAGVYGAIYMNEENRSMIGIDELVEKGYYKTFTTPKGNIAKRGSMTVEYNLVSVGEFPIGEEKIVREVFAFTARKENAISSTDDSDTDFDIEGENED